MRLEEITEGLIQLLNKNNYLRLDLSSMRHMAILHSTLRRVYVTLKSSMV